jgi:hypothetical protein
LTLAGLDVVVCADWSMGRERRAACVADMASRVVSALPPPADGWTVGALLQATETLAPGRSVLLAFDAPLGVPRSYLDSYRARFGEFRSFADWLEHACELEDFFSPVLSPERWAVERPFFRVPPGKGGLTAFVRAAAALEIDLKRDVERRLHAKSVFAMGIPGHVSHAAQALWREIVAERRGREFAIWPFEAQTPRVPVVAEIYPSSAAATLLDGRLGGSKGQRAVRDDAIQRLVVMPWFAGAGIRIDGLEYARSNEDDFDALLAALVLLRLMLEDRPLARDVDSSAEGAILGT